VAAAGPLAARAQQPAMRCADISIPARRPPSNQAAALPGQVNWQRETAAGAMRRIEQAAQGHDPETRARPRREAIPAASG
jgi:hypothetical protein